MADKSQNININYKFNTAEIEKANAILNRANQSTNNLQNAGAKTGTAFASGFRPAVQSIESMNQQLVRLKTQIQVSTDPKRVAELSNQFKVLKTQVDAANKSLLTTPKALSETKAATQSAAQQFGQLYTAAKLFLTAGVAKEALTIALSLAELKGNVEGVERAFARAFPNEISVLNRLRAATQGTITDFELMQRTLQATNLGVAIEPLPKLFEFAAARAQQTGESVDYLVDSIVRGIGRKSALILDNLGISALRLKEELGGVSLQAASVGQVTEAVGRIADAELTKMGGLAVTSATGVKQLNVAWEQLRITLAKSIDSSSLVGFLTNSVKGLDDLIKIIANGGFKQIDTEINKNIASVEALRVVESETYKSFADDNAKKKAFLLDEIAVRENQINEYNQLLAKEKERFLAIANSGKRVSYEQDKEVEGIKETIVIQERKRNAITATTDVLREYLAELDKVNEKETEPSGFVSRKKAEIEALEKQIELTNDLNDLGRATINATDDSKKASPAGRLLIQLEIAKAELAEFTQLFNDFKLKPAFKIELEKGTKTVSGVTYEVQRFKNELGTVARQSDTFIGAVTDIEKAMAIK